MIYMTNDKKTYTRDILIDALNKAEAAHPDWDTEDIFVTQAKWQDKGYVICAPGSHHMKAKVQEIYVIADRLECEAKGIKTFYVSMAIDARVDIEIRAKDLKEAMELAKNVPHEWDWERVDVVGTCPVNISDAEGNLLKDF